MSCSSGKKYEIGVIEPGTTRRAALKTVFVYICISKEKFVENYASTNFLKRSVFLYLVEAEAVK
jgi:hypothetical protein